MSDLERRYLRLLRLFYPAGYQNERGTEIVGTYLALATPARRWPSTADVFDLAGGGLRQHLRSVGATGIGPGTRLAGTLALLTTTALAGSWAVLETNPATTPWFGFSQYGPLVSLGVGVWGAWLLAAVVHAVAPGRWTRLAIGLGLLLTVAVVPLAAVTGLLRPPLFVLLPQACLGLIALGTPGRPPAWLRLLPLAGAAAAAPVAAAFLAQRLPRRLGAGGAAGPDRHADAAPTGRRTRRQPVRRRTERHLDDTGRRGDHSGGGRIGPRSAHADDPATGHLHPRSCRTLRGVRLPDQQQHESIAVGGIRRARLRPLRRAPCRIRKPAIAQCSIYASPLVAHPSATSRFGIPVVLAKDQRISPPNMIGRWRNQLVAQVHCRPLID